MLTVGLLVWRGDQLLMVRPSAKDVYYLPGGKVDPGEEHEAALHREIAEELSVGVTRVRHVLDIEAPAYGQPGMFTMRCYEGDLDGEPVASAEIGDIGYFTAAQYAACEQRAPAIEQLFERLAHR